MRWSIRAALVLLASTTLPGKVVSQARIPPPVTESMATFRVRTGAPRLTGTVRDGEGTALAGALVWVDADSTRATATDIRGHFALPLPAEGEHALRILARGQRGLEASFQVLPATAIDAEAILAPAIGPAVDAAAPPGRRYAIYLHGRIVEEGGRRPTDPRFGVYEYDAILDSLRQAGFVVLSEQRPPKSDSEIAAVHVADQVDSLLRLGVPPSAITVIGFSKGGWIAILASSRLHNPALSFVFLAACGPWAFERADLHVTGRLLSVIESSDSLGVSCAPMFQREGLGSRHREVALHLGLGHGTFFQPRRDWLVPVVAWARGREP
jgi:hypothetical protein